MKACGRTGGRSVRKVQLQSNLAAGETSVHAAAHIVLDGSILVNLASHKAQDMNMSKCERAYIVVGSTSAKSER